MEFNRMYVNLMVLIPTIVLYAAWMELLRGRAVHLVAAVRSAIDPQDKCHLRRDL